MVGSQVRRSLRWARREGDSGQATNRAAVRYPVSEPGTRPKDPRSLVARIWFLAFSLSLAGGNGLVASPKTPPPAGWWEINALRRAFFRRRVAWLDLLDALSGAKVGRHAGMFSRKPLCGWPSKACFLARASFLVWEAHPSPTWGECRRRRDRRHRADHGPRVRRR